MAGERTIIKDRFTDVLSEYPQWESLSKEDRETIVRRLERGCLNKTVNECTLNGIPRLWTDKQYKDRYSMECYRILCNLDKKSAVHSEYLAEQIFSGNIDASDVALMSNADLCPEANQEEREAINIRRGVKFDRKVSHSHTCKKCGKKETTYIDYQGSASDEASKLSIKCIHCGETWRR